MSRVFQISKNGQNESPQQLEQISFDDEYVWKVLLGHPKKEVEKEFALQLLVEKHPGILPWDDLPKKWNPENPEDFKVQVVCSGTSTASTDVVLIELTGSNEGRFVIVETKLARNPEIAREVLGQIIEYGSRLVGTEEKEQLKKKSETYWLQRGFKFESMMKEKLGSDWEKTWDSAYERLKLGEVRLLIVSDRVPDELKRSVIFFGSSFLTSVVEVYPFYSQDGKSVVFNSNATSSEGNIDQLKSKLKEFSQGILFSLVSLQILKDSAGFVVRSSATSSEPVRIPHEKVDLEKFEGQVNDIGGSVVKFYNSLKKCCGEENLAPQQNSVTFRFHNIAGLVATIGPRTLQFCFNPGSVAKNGILSKEEVMKYWREELVKFTKEHGIERNVRDDGKPARERVRFQIKADTPDTVIETLVKKIVELYGWLHERQA